jgi:glycosyltransferase involved in cell wall biosynthesis
MKKQSVLFVYVHYSSFVKADFDILSTFCNVTKYQFKPGKGIIRTGFELLKELCFLIFLGFRYDSIFIWFSDYHSLLPVLFANIFRKKSFVVLGGYDVSSLPEYNYGALINPIRRFFTRNTIKYVSLCFPVAEALKKKLYEIDPEAKAETIATNQNAEKFDFIEYDRPKRVITVSATKNYQRLMVKGLDRFRELAEYLPEFEFIIVGATDSIRPFLEPFPSNLVLLQSQNFDEMTQVYQGASYYAQLSRSEGLPNALCEAMLCGCIPVGTNVGDIQIAIGDSGLTIKEWRPELLAEFIDKNQNNRRLRDEARSRIKALYDPDIRTQRLRHLVGKSSKLQ